MLETIVVIVSALAGIANTHADTITLPQLVPYAADSEIAGHIRRSCDLDGQLADFVAENIKSHGMTVTLVGAVDVTAPGLVLDMQITDATSEDSTFGAHRTSMAAIGRLYQDGVLRGNFTGRRNSMGGIWAANVYKNSCSVLSRTVKALGNDIGEWARAPSMDAELGDQKTD